MKRCLAKRLVLSTYFKQYRLEPVGTQIYILIYIYIYIPIPIHKLKYIDLYTYIYIYTYIHRWGMDGAQVVDFILVGGL